MQRLSRTLLVQGRMGVLIRLREHLSKPCQFVGREKPLKATFAIALDVTHGVGALWSYIPLLSEGEHLRKQGEHPIRGTPVCERM